MRQRSPRRARSVTRPLWVRPGWEVCVNTADAKPSVLQIAFAFAYVLALPVLLLWLSGNWRWPEGWVFTIWFLGLCYVTILYLYRNDPALLSERYRRPGTGGQSVWDLFVVIGLVVGFTAWIVLMPLDSQRFGWSPQLPVWLQVLGLAMLVGSSVLFFRSYKDNPYVSALVRVQEDRGQQVVSTGVYGFVRHPMYLGGSLLFLGAPLLLGSVWGLVVGSALVLLLAARIVGEERTLAADLEGYEEYRPKVKYRLVPGIW